MFLYRFIHRRRRRPQTVVHAITFEQLFGCLSFLAQLFVLTYRLPDYIFVMTLTLNFQGQIWNLLYLRQKWSDCHETKSKHIDWNLGLKCDHRVWPWPWPWPWIFKVKHWICYISAKNGPIARKRKSKHIDWTQGPKCNHQLWPWPWPWPWFFKVKYVICYISSQNGPIAIKRKANILIEPSNVTIRCDLGHGIWNLLYLNQKRSDYHEMKSKHIEWIPGIKCDQWVWLWQWPWSLNFLI